MISTRFLACPIKSFVCVLILGLATAGRLLAQGGPPMITDDPGTPGDKHWEINIAWVDQHTEDGQSLHFVPLIDANYGWGDRIQLNYQASWNILKTDEGTINGASDTQLAVKWRYYDAGEHGLQLSIYPRVFFLNPQSDSGRRGLTDSHYIYFFPFEVQKDFDWFNVNIDFGHQFSTYLPDRLWEGGICIGREVMKGWEIDAEIRENVDDALHHTETIVNFGTRYDLSEHATIILAIGRDTQNHLGPTVSLLSYVGIQFRL